MSSDALLSAMKSASATPLHTSGGGDAGAESSLVDAFSGVSSVWDVIFYGVNTKNSGAVLQRMMKAKESFIDAVREHDESAPLRSVRTAEWTALEALGERGVPYAWYWRNASKDLCLIRSYVLDEDHEFDWPICAWAPAVQSEIRFMHTCNAALLAPLVMLAGAVAGLLLARALWGRVPRSSSSSSSSSSSPPPPSSPPPREGADAPLVSYAKAARRVMGWTLALATCLVVDALGTLSFCLPVYGMLTDAAYAPLAALLAFAALRSVPGALLVGLKELLPLTDLVPLATALCVGMMVM